MMRAILASALVLAGCARRGDGGGFRLGFFPNVTHSQALVGNADGTFVKALGKPIEVRQFNAGPAAMEVLLAGALDASYVGSGPATVAFIRSGGSVLRVIAGAVSGGAALVSHQAKSAEDLKGKRVASPQLGNTQDIALRFWLKSAGIPIVDIPSAKGVTVTPLANPDILG